MAQRKSTGLVNMIAGRTGIRQAMANGKIEIYSGSQPATADDAPTGTLLCTITKASGAYVGETLPEWKITLAGASGSVNTIKLGGTNGIDLLPTAISFTTDLATTASAIAAAITNNLSVPDVDAYTVGGADIFIKGPPGAGASMNGIVVATTVTTMTATVASAGVPFTQGVTAVNGLNFDFPPVNGRISKEVANAWSGQGLVAGTAGWFRFKIDPADNNTSSTVFRRLDGAIATSGAEMNLSSTAVAIGATLTINTFTVDLNK